MTVVITMMVMNDSEDTRREETKYKNTLSKQLRAFANPKGTNHPIHCDKRDGREQVQKGIKVDMKS